MSELETFVRLKYQIDIERINDTLSRYPTEVLDNWILKYIASVNTSAYPLEYNQSIETSLQYKAGANNSTEMTRTWRRTFEIQCKGNEFRLVDAAYCWASDNNFVASIGNILRLESFRKDIAEHLLIEALCEYESTKESINDQ